MIEIKGIRVSVMESVTQLEKQIQKKLKLNHVLEYIILRRSIDARKKNDIHYVYQVGVFSKDEKKILKKVNDKNVMLTKRTYYHFPQSGTSVMKHHPIIVGAGPAGLFCGLFWRRWDMSLSLLNEDCLLKNVWQLSMHFGKMVH